MQDTLKINTDIYRDEHRCRRQRRAPEHQSPEIQDARCKMQDEKKERRQTTF